MKSWDGVGSAYAASYASLCLGTAEDLRTALDPGDRGRFRAAFDAVSAQYIVGDVLRLAHTAAVAVGRSH
ncbi:MAG: hypothetical protein ACQEW8_00910 [Actinomycetota bacterium]